MYTHIYVHMYVCIYIYAGVAMYTFYTVKVSVKRSNKLSSPSVPIRSERKKYRAQEENTKKGVKPTPALVAILQKTQRNRK